LRRPFVPAEVLTAAHERAAARALRDWATADRLRGVIEASGWRVVDVGGDFRLEPAHPPDTVEADRVRHGRSEAVPSRLEEPPQGLATVVLLATDDIPDVSRAMTALRAFAPPGTSLAFVADGIEGDALAEVESLASATGGATGADLTLTSARLGHAAALNIGIRRSIGPVIIVLDASVEPTGDLVTPLVRALEDPGVAIAGPFGLASDDLRRFREVTHGHVAAIEGYVMAFRRADAAERGPLDEHFRFYRNLDIWWSLALRDEGEDRAPRRAEVVPDLPLVRHAHRAWEATPALERDRLSKRNFYRILDRFGRRMDLAVPGDAIER
jgi:Glycosyl transferase family 2